MNSQITMPEKRSINKLVLISLIVCLGVLAADANAWEIDLSKRRKQFHRDPASEPTPAKAQNADTGFLDQVLPANPSATEVVIISTEEGFIPKQVRLRKDTSYTIYLVNVNEKEKNASFILDAFSEHHGTYFGKIKKFTMTPKKEGVYSFSSPETGFEGRVVVFQGEAQRNLSSQPKD